MILTEYLVYILSLSKNIFDMLIYFERELLLCIEIAVVIAMAVCTFKVIFLCYTSLSILRGFDHLRFNARFTGIHTAAKHNNRLSRSMIESLLALKT
jgi:hypothetical protein